MNNLILLTASGFTMNFGGFSDKKIRNTIKDHLTDKELIKRIDKNPYEQIYQELNFDGSNTSDTERKQFNEGIINAYEAMDRSITERMEKLNFDEKNILQAFLKKFNYVFTLNQDLFLEKSFGYHSLLTNRFSDDCHALNPFYNLSNGDFGHPDLVTSEFEELLQEQPHRDDFKYFKIHGSYAWRDVDDSNIHIMGVGFSKQLRIKDYPLLRIYESFFGNRLTDGKGMLVIFGYGFSDMHINNYIYWGINAGLKLIVIGWDSFDNFKGQLKEKIERTYSYDNIQLPSPKNLKIQICEQSNKIINAINEYHSLKDKNILDFLKNF